MDTMRDDDFYMCMQLSMIKTSNTVRVSVPQKFKKKKLLETWSNALKPFIPLPDTSESTVQDHLCCCDWL